MITITLTNTSKNNNDNINKSNNNNTNKTNNNNNTVPHFLADLFVCERAFGLIALCLQEQTRATQRESTTCACSSYSCEILNHVFRPRLHLLYTQLPDAII